MSDHFLVETKMSLPRTWGRKSGSKRKSVISYKRPKEETVRKEKERPMKIMFASMGQKIGKCKEEWKEFRNSMEECAKSVCGVRRIGGNGRGTEWWDGDVQCLVERKEII